MTWVLIYMSFIPPFSKPKYNLDNLPILLNNHAQDYNLQGSLQYHLKSYTHIAKQFNIQKKQEPITNKLL